MASPRGRLAALTRCAPSGPPAKPAFKRHCLLSNPCKAGSSPARVESGASFERGACWKDMASPRGRLAALTRCSPSGPPAEPAFKRQCLLSNPCKAGSSPARVELGASFERGACWKNMASPRGRLAAHALLALRAAGQAGVQKAVRFVEPLEGRFESCQGRVGSEFRDGSGLEKYGVP